MEVDNLLEEHDYIHKVYLEISEIDKNIASLIEKTNDTLVMYNYNTSLRKILCSLAQLINLFKKFFDNNENIIENIKTLYLEKDNLFESMIDNLNNSYQYDIILLLEKYFNTNDLEYKKTLNIKYIELITITQIVNKIYDEILNKFISNIDIENIDNNIDDDTDEE